MKFKCRECEFDLKINKYLIFMNNNIRFHCLYCERSCNKCRLINEYHILSRYRTYEFELYEDDTDRFLICHKGNKSDVLNVIDAESYLFHANERGALFYQLNGPTGDEKQDKVLKSMLHEAIKRGLFYYFLKKQEIIDQVKQ